MQVLQLAVPAADAELAADRLWTAGAGAVEEVALPAGRVGLRTILADDRERSSDRLGPIPADWVIDWIDVPDEPSLAWRAHVAPIAVGDRLVIRPAWIPPHGGRRGRVAVAIEPGGSFGLGDHPTTRLTAAATVRLTTPGCSVLDVGCGSGVLGIVAVRFGAAHVDAIDIAEAAVEATRDNAARNGVAAEVTAATTPIGAIAGRYDLVLANVLAPALVAMADDLRRVVAPGGTLVISGILAGAHDHVLAALAPLRAVRTEVLDGWAAVELRW